MLKITLDTNILGEDKMNILRRAIKSLDVDLVTISVSDREIRGSYIQPLNKQLLETAVWDESEWDKAVWGGDTLETFILGESELGKGRLGSPKSSSLFEEILKIVSNESFPVVGSRDNLTKRQKHDLRDAMILEAHAREKRDILISDDKKAYIGKDGKKRIILEKLCGTRIMTFDEFLSWIQSQK